MTDTEHAKPTQPTILTTDRTREIYRAMIAAPSSAADPTAAQVGATVPPTAVSGGLPNERPHKGPERAGVRRRHNHHPLAG